MDEEKRRQHANKLEPMDVVKTAWKCYIPAAVTGTVSVACLIGASSVNARTTEEIVKAASNGGMKKATTIGLAMIAGALTYKFVVVPATAKFKNWRENRKTVVTQPKGDIVDGEFTDIDEETEEDSE